MVIESKSSQEYQIATRIAHRYNVPYERLWFRIEVASLPIGIFTTLSLLRKLEITTFSVPRMKRYIRESSLEGVVTVGIRKIMLITPSATEELLKHIS